MADVKDEFPKRLRFIRELREMTQAQLGKASGLDPTAIAHFENGRRMPSMPNLKAIAKGAMVSADYLLGLSERTFR